MRTEMVGSYNSQAFVPEREDVKEMLYKRPKDGNKGTFGKVLIVAGSVNMKGAALLCAKGCFCVGAGMVKVLSDEVNARDYLEVCPELMVGRYNGISKEELQKEINWCDACAVGPGLSINEETEKLVRNIMELCDKPLLVDADGLNILAKDMSYLRKRKERGYETIITPHPAEFVRLFGDGSESDKKHNNPEYIKSLAKEYGIVLVAKDAKTMITDGEKVYMNTFGNSGLGRAGSGDILSGVIGGLMHNSKDLLTAAVLGVTLHALGADEAVKVTTEYSLESNEIIEGIKKVIKDTIR